MNVLLKKLLQKLFVLWDINAKTTKTKRTTIFKEARKTGLKEEINVSERFTLFTDDRLLVIGDTAIFRRLDGSAI